MMALERDFLVGREGEEYADLIESWTGFDRCTFTKLFECTPATASISAEFKKACLRKGPTVTIARLSTGHIIGGFTARSWELTGVTKEDTLAFIFRLHGPAADDEPAVFRPKPNSSLTVNDYDGWLPGFGSSTTDQDLHFFNNSRLEFRSEPRTFSEPAGTFPATGTAITQLEVYQVVPLYPDAGRSAGSMGVWRSLKFTESCAFFPRAASPALTPCAPPPPPPPASPCIPSSQPSVLSTCTPEKKRLSEALCGRMPYCGEHLGVEVYNVLLFGGVGAGKSSWLNALDSAFLGRVSMLANVGSGAASITTPLTKRELEGTNVCLWDTMGWTEETYTKDEFENIIRGHVPDGFDLRTPMTLSTEGLVRDRAPTLAERVHVVAFIVPAESLTSRRYLDRLRAFIACARGTATDLRVFILVSKVDEIDRRLGPDVSGVFESEKMLRARDRLAGPGGVGVPAACVVPIKSYASETSTSAATDVLNLDALTRLLDAADDYLRARRPATRGGGARDRRPAPHAAGAPQAPRTAPDAPNTTFSPKKGN
eukprot:tig00020961_g16692.t1